jgi:hypothetical protein
MKLPPPSTNRIVTGATPLLMSRIAMGEAVLRDIDATVGCLVRGGFSYAQADW